ncbi:hypothetical protein [Pseudoalteromonas sp. Of7M-16]|uniref:hypothetical protein n=1 Tax=Pseudoalteromonas sp. Of7M-16 TaxID=2917756 RepID=UPI001EF40882|nr:hypothetical protein [Pseudoalteromonas sp. Of7M-16]MCG7550947.1 hypothetical protein [Pseudoalteromonas sp. Of7M-16]
MASYVDSRANRKLLRGHYEAQKAIGEKLLGAMFDLRVEGHPELNLTVRSTQHPQVGYQDVEDHGQGGMLINQAGAFENSGEITIQFVETLRGSTLKAIKEIILNKEQPKIQFIAMAESSGLIPHTGYTLHDVKLRLDAVDFATENVTELVKPNVTCKYGWVDFEGVDY